MDVSPKQCVEGDIIEKDDNTMDDSAITAKEKPPLAPDAPAQLQVRKQLSLDPVDPADCKEFSESKPATPNVSSSTPKPDLRLKPRDFRILCCLGTGTYGKVVQVLHKGSKKVYALKILDKKHMVKENLVESAKTEREIMTRVKHPFIITLEAAFQSPSKLYLLMEFVSGGELFWHIRAKGTFVETRAVVYMAEVVLALEHLHSKNIVHRDLKPENVLLGYDGHIVLTDFGLSKHGQRMHTMCGTDEYMAPEMISGGGYGKSVDWWAFGCLCFEMLTGAAPFRAHNPKKLYKLIISKKIKLPPYLSPKCHSLIKGLLDRRVEERLGCGKSDMFTTRGVQRLKNHDFFSDLCWHSVYLKRVKPPIVPELSSSVDTKHFDEQFTLNTKVAFTPEIKGMQGPSGAGVPSLSLNSSPPSKSTVAPIAETKKNESPLSSPTNEFKGFSWVRPYTDETSEGSNPLYMPTPPSPVQPKREDHDPMPALDLSAGSGKKGRRRRKKKKNKTENKTENQAGNTAKPQPDTPSDAKPEITNSAVTGDISTTTRTDTSKKEDTKLSEAPDKSNPKAVAKSESMDVDAKIDPSKSAATATNTKEEAKTVDNTKREEISPQKIFKPAKGPVCGKPTTTTTTTTTKRGWTARAPDLDRDIASQLRRPPARAWGLATKHPQKSPRPPSKPPSNTTHPISTSHPRGSPNRNNLHPHSRTPRPHTHPRPRPATGSWVTRNSTWGAAHSHRQKQMQQRTRPPPRPSPSPSSPSRSPRPYRHPHHNQSPTPNHDGYYRNAGVGRHPPRSPSPVRPPSIMDSGNYPSLSHASSSARPRPLPQWGAKKPQWGARRGLSLADRLRAQNKSQKTKASGPALRATAASFVPT